MGRHILRASAMKLMFSIMLGWTFDTIKIRSHSDYALGRDESTITTAHYCSKYSTILFVTVFQHDMRS